jgi:ankyrin repeat protein
VRLNDRTFRPISAGIFLLLALCVSHAPLLASPLVDAATAGDEPAVRAILSSGKGLEEKDRALFKAAENGRTAAVRLLLENRADPNALASEPCCPQWTPLMIAAAQGHRDVVSLLLDGGADVKARNNYGRTALMYPSVYGYTEIIRLLLDKGAEVNARPTDGQGATALASAAGHGHAATVDLLLQRGANVNAALDDGMTPLMMATQGGHAAVVDRLLAAGAKADAVSSGETALIIAVKEGHADIVRRLLGAGANPNDEYRSSKGVRASVLIMSVELGWEPIVEALLANGADVRYRDDRGVTPLDVAQKKGNPRIVELLKKTTK